MITKPVLEIQRRLLQISNGDFSRDTSIEWNHELGDIGKKVNNLAENIKQLLDSAVESEKQQRDLEYKVLQSQVNPHFLYNTLNSIKWMAITQGATGISEMTTALSRLLKSIAKGTRLIIPISDELNLLNDYFTIQQYRYGGTLKLYIDVPDELKSYMILKFTLQPIVENAIFHGIEPTGKAGEINITFLKKDENTLEITVRDNGVGMSPELIDKVLNDEESSSSEFFREFGISNIQKRLKYEFGDDYGIRIESEVDKFTSMIITIPLISEVTNYV
jgi:two-component system sensor histidine kinase YesM